jgi:hypothetical protein
MEPAAARRAEEDGQQRGRGSLVDPDQAGRRGCGEARRAFRGGDRAHGALGGAGGDTRQQASANARSILANGQWIMDERATRSRSHEGGSRSWWRRKASLIRRFARFRRTAGPTAWVEATKHARRRAAPPARAVHHAVNAPQSSRLPCWRTARISLWRRRCCAGRKRMGSAIPKVKRRSGACGPSCGAR